MSRPTWTAYPAYQNYVDRKYEFNSNNFTANFSKAVIAIIYLNWICCMILKVVGSNQKPTFKIVYRLLKVIDENQILILKNPLYELRENQNLL